MPSATSLTILRLSALGDVAMLLPVVRAMREQHPGVPVTVVSQPFVAALFARLEGVRFVAADIRHRHRGLRGLWRLAGELQRRGAVGRVADMHGVLRARLLVLFLRLRLLPGWPRVARIDKGRRGKRALTRAWRKRRAQQRHSVLRYADVLGRLGYEVDVPCAPGGWRALPGGGGSPLGAEGLAPAPRVGLAPFAKHRGKMYPLERSFRVVQLLAEAGCGVYLFGGRGEMGVLSEWAAGVPGCVVVPGLSLDLAGELDLMRGLDAMVSMDSANMHLASWAGVPVVSVWGATHPYAGFLGWGQPEAYAVQRDDLDCRPCSVFGNKPCRRGDYACMDVAPERVAQRLLQLLGGVLAAAQPN